MIVGITGAAVVGAIGLTTVTAATAAGSLTLNRPATASAACNSNEGPSKAVNGTVSGGNTDKWCSGVSGGFLQVDLGSTASITSFVVHHAQAGGENAAWNTRDFDLQVSADGVNFLTAVAVRGNTAGVSTHPITASARIVRLKVLVPTQNTDKATRIYEFEAFGTLGPPPTPNPPTPPPTTGPPTGDTKVTVPAARLFADSTVHVTKGSQVTVSATGTWQHKSGSFGPGGNPSAGSGPCQVAQLTGRVGLYGKNRCFSDKAISFTAEQDGSILFWMNDGPGVSGSLTVTVSGGTSGKPAALPRPPVADPANFDQVCNPPFTFRDEDTTGGGKVFTDEVPNPAVWFRGIARDVCSRLYKQSSEARSVTSITLYLRNCDGVAAKWGDREISVEVCTPYLRTVKNSGRSVGDEVTGIMTHETTHGYQYDDKPDSNPDIGIIEGVADAVRFGAGYISPGELHTGGAWNSGYKTSALFFVWLDTKYPDFLHRFNQSFKPDGKAWSSAAFQQITGKPVNTLWSEYQVAIGGAKASVRIVDSERYADTGRR